ncbi:unnamed protein product [marine sediment metagenome]|uniref:Ligand-binding protein SH3 n=1 Tax=marine sediment metagenome TaxID=412755 RepID=X1BG87_9ZZZZ
MFLVNWFSGWSPELATLVIAAIPVGELRVSLPVALTVYHLDFWPAFILSVFGTLTAAIVVMAVLDPITRFARKYSQPINRALEWLFRRTRKKHQSKFEKYRDLTLILFVAIPLPFTGAYTGALAAYVFGVPFRRAFPLIAIGVIIAAAIVTAVTLGFKSAIYMVF